MTAKIHQMSHEVLFGNVGGECDFSGVLFFSTFGNTNKFKVGARDVSQLC